MPVGLKHRRTNRCVRASWCREDAMWSDFFARDKKATTVWEKRAALDGLMPPCSIWRALPLSCGAFVLLGATKNKI